MGRAGLRRHKAGNCLALATVWAENAVKTLHFLRQGLKNNENGRCDGRKVSHK